MKKKTEEVQADVQVQYSADGQFYAVPEVVREGGIWLGVEKHPLPVPPSYRRPGVFGAAVMRGRDYYRSFSAYPLRAGRVVAVPADDDMVADWRDASWWSPGLEP